MHIDDKSLVAFGTNNLQVEDPSGKLETIPVVIGPDRVHNKLAGCHFDSVAPPCQRDTVAPALFPAGTLHSWKTSLNVAADQRKLVSRLPEKKRAPLAGEDS